MIGGIAVLSLMLLAPQAVEKPPVLSELDKLRIQNAVQKIEIAQLKFNAARDELMALLNSLEKDGYTLDISTLGYKKKDEPKK